MKTFDHAWIVHALEEHASCFTKRMFGGLAIYVFGRMMMILVEPTKSGRWDWHGVLFPTEREHHPGIVQQFPELAPHYFLKKWLFIDSRHDDFEPAMERVLKAIARNDQRFGIQPQPMKKRN